ncbi:hypothetical protein [Sporosarcina koreensis]|nr:hypothetical protein [Sporosarcina koreensis]
MNAIIAIVGILVFLKISYEIGKQDGYNVGYRDGYEYARKWWKK